MRTPSRLTVYTLHDGTQITVRSALEARWAIFFSELRLEWKYEPITFDWYTPDFGVVGLGLIEIKPTLESLISESADKIRRTARRYTKEKIYSFVGNKVSFGLVAMWHGDQLFAPKHLQMNRIIKELSPHDAGRAMNRANTAKLDHFVSVGKVIDLNRIAHEETARFKEKFK
jgi:hypothetical protein